MDCHAGEKPEGGLELASASLDVADADVRRRWVYLYDRVADGEMPPKSHDAPSAAAKARFLASLGQALSQADRAGREVVLRRLNRNEYQNTVNDLFGVRVDVSRLLPDDSSEQGFDTMGANLSLSAEQLVLYVEAADLVLDEVLGPPRKPDRLRRAWSSKDSKALRSSVRVSEQGIALFNEETFVIREASAPVPGTYRLRFQAKAVQSDKPVVIRVDGGISMQIAPYVSGFFEIPPGFALESFDVIGNRRDWYRTRGAGQYVKKPRHPLTPNATVLYRRGPDVDSSGTVDDGRSFDGIREYKRLLLGDETLMPRALTQLLLTYALGRELGFSDRPEVQRIVDSIKEDDYGLRSMIHAVVQSPTFRSP